MMNDYNISNFLYLPIFFEYVKCWTINDKENIGRYFLILFVNDIRLKKKNDFTGYIFGWKRSFSAWQK